MPVRPIRDKLVQYALTATMGNDVDDLVDAKNNEIGDKLAEFGKHQKSETEPETKYSTEIRYVLYRLHTIHTMSRKKCADTKLRQYYYCIL